FSTTICFPRISVRRCATTRPLTSTGPPAANGTTMLTGRAGQSCATALPPATKVISARPNATFIENPPVGQRLAGRAVAVKRRLSDTGNSAYQRRMGTPDTRIAIAGLGAIGREVARRLKDIPGVALACAAARDRDKAQDFLDRAGLACPIVPLEKF